MSLVAHDLVHCQPAMPLVVPMLALSWGRTERVLLDLVKGLIRYVRADPVLLNRPPSLNLNDGLRWARQPQRRPPSTR